MDTFPATLLKGQLLRKTLKHTHTKTIFLFGCLQSMKNYFALNKHITPVYCVAKLQMISEKERQLFLHLLAYQVIASYHSLALAN